MIPFSVRSDVDDLQNHDEVILSIQPTPNPQAYKYILRDPVKNSGKVTFADSGEARVSVLASSLFQIPGVKQIHFFENVVTITFSGEASIEELHDSISAVIHTRLPIHNPDFTVEKEQEKLRNNVSPEIQKIEEILDRTVRPGLQADGGDLEIVSLVGHDLEVRYMGACGGCPSSTMNTLYAIESILKDEFDPEIQIFPV